MLRTLRRSMRRWLFILYTYFHHFCNLCNGKNIEEYKEVIFYICEIDLFWLSSSFLNNLCNCKKHWEGVWEGMTLLPFVRLICSDFHDLCNQLGEGRPLRQPEGEKVLQSWKGATASSSGSSTELCFDWFEIGNYHFLWLQVDWKAYEPVRPSFLGTRVFDNYDLSKLVRLLFTF